MKFNLKMTAIAAAMVASGAANAAFVAGNVGNSTLGLLAFNTSTGSYYLRDTGFFMNTFLPSDGAAITPSGDAAASTFDKTPATGLTLNAGNTASFADAAFSSWLSGQTNAASNVRWTVIASDSQNTSATNRLRQIGAIASSTTFTPSNGAIAGGTVAINGFADATFGLSKTGTLSSGQLTASLGNFVNQAGLLTALDSTANLYYWTRSTTSSSTGLAAFENLYDNAAGPAILSLASNGDFSYSLAPVSAVPLPAAAWLMGAGLVGLGGVIRRRKAAAQA